MIMKLGTYLDTNNIRATDFATNIGVSPSTVGRWVKNERYPRPEQFQIIAAATNGAVTANDFYDTSEVPA